MFRIEVIVRQNETRLGRYELAPGEYLIGRDPACQIRVDLPEISLRHARLVYAAEHGALRLEDLGSSNGTSVDGLRLQSAFRFRPPQQIQLGTAVLEFKEPDSAADSRPDDARDPAPAGAGLPDELERSHMYRPCRQITQGGMGAILEAKDANLGRAVALKRMLAGKNASREQRLRFVQEARVLGRLEHPNIVPIHEMGLDAEGQVFYTMKLVKGVTLRQVLEDIGANDPKRIARYPLTQLLTVFQKVCDAISFAHSQGVIHRDLKPENVMLGDFGEVLVMDWGLAKIIAHKQPAETAIGGFQETELSAADGGFRTLEGKIMGTPNFMAPEQAEGRIGDIDARTDVFALGGILYNILTLMPPVNGATASEIFEKIKRGDIAPPSTFNATTSQGKRSNKTGDTRAIVLPHCPGRRIPEALSAVAMKALATDPASRYQSAEELQRDLAAYQGGFATSAEQAGAWKLLKLAVKRRQTEFAVCAGALGIILLLAGAFVWKQTSTLRELRGTAPTFYQQALAAMEEQKFDDALQRIDYALSLRRNDAAYHVLRGNILQTLLRLPEAREAYARALKLKPGQTPVQQSRELCEQLSGQVRGTNGLPTESLETLRSLMLDQGRSAEALAIAQRMTKGIQDTYDYWKGVLQKAGWKGTLTKEADNTLHWDSSPDAEINDLSVIRGMPLSSLDLAGGRVSDLGSLRGMRLKRLGISHAESITDLAPLRGMPLEVFALDGECAVADLTPLSVLRGKRLQGLGLRETKVRDLTSLKGQPIKRLNLSSCPVGDISPLRGAPLVELYLDTTPVSDISALKGAPLKQLWLNDTPVQDISALHGAPLQVLRLQNTHISDISALRGMPLQELRLDGCRNLKDLSPLADCKELENLSIPVLYQGIEFLRRLPKLKYLTSYSVPNNQWTVTAGQFWTAYDARNR